MHAKKILTIGAVALSMLDVGIWTAIAADAREATVKIAPVVEYSLLHFIPLRSSKEDFGAQKLYKSLIF